MEEASADEVYNPQTPVEVQQEYCELLCGRDWDCFTVDEYSNIKAKVGFALFGAPPETNEQDTDGVYTAKQQKQIDTVYEKIIENGQFDANPGTIYLAPIFTICQNLKNASEFYQQAVFRLRKCHRKENINEKYLQQQAKRAYGFNLSTVDRCENYCRIFVDAEGRVYKSWLHYLRKNNLEKCNMYIPRNGVYKVDDTGAVLLDVVKSPSCSIGHRIVNAADTAGTVASVTCVGIGAVTLIPAVMVAPVVLAGAGAVALGTGVYAAARGVVGLVDRKSHQQTLALTDSRARGQWLNAAGGLTTFVTGGTTQLLEHAIEKGAIVGNVGRAAFNAVVGTNMLINGCGVVNSLHCVVEKKLSGEKLSNLELFQLTSTVMFFGHAIWSARTAQTFIKETQARVLADYHTNLNNTSLRRMFTQALRDAQGLKGVEAGNAEMIQGLRNIKKPDYFFTVLLRNNNSFNNEGAQFRVAPDGKIGINGTVFVEASEFASLSDDARDTMLTSVRDNKDVIVNSLSSYKPPREDLDDIVKTVLSTITTSNDLRDAISQILDRFEVATRVILLDVISFVFRKITDQYNIIETLYPYSEKLLIVLQFVIKFIERQCDGCVAEDSGANSHNLFDRIVTSMTQYNCRGNAEFSALILHEFRVWVETRLRFFVDTQFQSIERMSKSTEHNCNICKGVYYTM